MSRGIAAARHLFGGHCCEKGRRLATEVTRAEADLRTAARKLAHNPERRGLFTSVQDAKAHQADARERAAAHELECGVDLDDERLSCDLCFEGAPCIEHVSQARESAARDAAERARS